MRYYYSYRGWQERKRQQVDLDVTLRAETLAVIKGAHEIILSAKTPAPISNKKRCRACLFVA